MNPKELSRDLLAIAEYMDGIDRPSYAMTVASIRIIDAKLKVAAKVSEVVKTEFDSTIQQVGSLIDRLTKIAKTLNPQDESRSELESSIAGFKSAKSDIMSIYGSLSGIEL